MRKGLAVLLLVLCLGVPAMAEDTQASIALEPHAFDVGFDMLVPAEWTVLDMRTLMQFDEVDQAQMGFLPDLYLAYGDEASGQTIHLTAWRSQMPTEADIAKMEKDFGNAGTWDTVNDMRAFVYYVREQDVGGAYVWAGDMLICVSGIPGKDHTLAKTMDTMLYSITLRADIPDGED